MTLFIYLENIAFGQLVGVSDRYILCKNQIGTKKWCNVASFLFVCFFLVRITMDLEPIPGTEGARQE